MPTKIEKLLRDYFKELKKYPPLSKQEEEILLERFKQGDPKARAKLILANLRFVVTVAKKYRFINEVPFEDLIAVGNLGLLRAATRFKVGRKVRFISYAVWWIKQAIIHLLSLHTSTIRLPINKVNFAIRMKKAENNLIKKLNRKPMVEEVALEMGVKVDDLKKFILENPIVVSLDSPVNSEEDDLLLADTIPDPKGDPLKLAEEKALKEEIQKVMNILSDKERLVLDFRFGLKSSKTFTLEEIGKLIGVTRERVRQIEAQALQKLRHPTRLCRLSVFRS